MPSKTPLLATGVCFTSTTQTDPIYSHVRHLETSNDSQYIFFSTKEKGDDRKTKEIADPSPIFHLEKIKDEDENGKKTSKHTLETSKQKAIKQENDQTELSYLESAPVTKGSKKWKKSPASEGKAKNKLSSRQFPLRVAIDTPLRQLIHRDASAGQDDIAVHSNPLQSRNEHKQYKVEHIQDASSQIEPSYSYIGYYPTPKLCWEHRENIVRNLRAEFQTVHDRKDLKRKDTISWIHPKNQSSSTNLPSSTSVPSDSAIFYEGLDAMLVDASEFPQWISPDDRRLHRGITKDKIHKHVTAKPFAHSSPIPGVKMRRSEHKLSDSSKSWNHRISRDSTPESAANDRTGRAIRASPLIKGSKKWWRTPGKTVNDRSSRRPPSWAELETPKEQTVSGDMPNTVDSSRSAYDGWIKLRNGHKNTMAKYIEDISSCNACFDQWISWVHNFGHSTPKLCRDHLRSFRGRCSESEFYLVPTGEQFKSEDGNNSIEHESPLYLSNANQRAFLLSETLPSKLDNGRDYSDLMTEGDESSEIYVQYFPQNTTIYDDFGMYSRSFKAKPFAHSSLIRDYCFDVPTTEDSVYDPKMKDAPLAQSTPLSKTSAINKVIGKLPTDSIYGEIYSRNMKTEPFEYPTPAPKDSRISEKHQECGLSGVSTYDKIHSRNTKAKPFAHSTPVHSDRAYIVKEEYNEALTDEKIGSQSVKAKPFLHSTPVHKSTINQECPKLSKSSRETEQLTLDTTAGTESTSWKYYRMKPPAPISPIIKGARKLWQTPRSVLSGVCDRSSGEIPSWQVTPAKKLEGKDKSSSVNGGVSPASEVQTDSKQVQTDGEHDMELRPEREFSFSRYIETMIEVAGRSENPKLAKRFRRDKRKALFDFDNYCKRLHSLIHIQK